MVRVFYLGFIFLATVLSSRSFALSSTDDCLCDQGPDVKGIFEITEYLSPYVTQKEREAKIEKDLEHYSHHDLLSSQQMSAGGQKREALRKSVDLLKEGKTL